MRKYYLFIIKNDYYSLYKKRPKVLYSTLENLYNLKKPNFKYGISLYEGICKPFSIKLLNNYIKNKFEYKLVNDKIIELCSIKEKTRIQIKYSCIIIYTNINFPDIFKIFNIYNKKIFICDFKLKDYFWLNDQIIKRKGTF